MNIGGESTTASKIIIMATSYGLIMLLVIEVFFPFVINRRSCEYIAGHLESDAKSGWLLIYLLYGLLFVGLAKIISLFRA